MRRQFELHSEGSHSVFDVAEFVDEMILQSLIGRVDLACGEDSDGRVIELRPGFVDDGDEAIEGVLQDGVPDGFLVVRHFSERIQSVLQRSRDERFGLQPDLLDQLGRVVARDDDADGTCPRGRFCKDAALFTDTHRDVVPAGGRHAFHRNEDRLCFGHLLDFPVELMAVGDESTGAVDRHDDALDRCVIGSLLNLPQPAFGERRADRAREVNHSDAIRRTGSSGPLSTVLDLREQSLF